MDGFPDVGREIIDGPAGPVRFGDQARELAPHVAGGGEPRETVPPFLRSARRDRRLAQVVEDEPEAGTGECDLGGGVQFARRDLQVEGQPRVRDRVQATAHAGPQQPLRVRFVRGVVPDAHQALASGTCAQIRELPGDMARGEIDPPDDSGDELMAGRQPEQLPGLAEIGPDLDHDRGAHLVGG